MNFSVSSTEGVGSIARSVILTEGCIWEYVVIEHHYISQLIFSKWYLDYTRRTPCISSLILKAKYEKFYPPF